MSEQQPPPEQLQQEEEEEPLQQMQEKELEEQQDVDEEESPDNEMILDELMEGDIIVEELVVDFPINNEAGQAGEPCDQSMEADEQDPNTTDMDTTVDNGGDEEDQDDEEDNGDDNESDLNSSNSRELKQLLALSKEAKLETNISHKRKATSELKYNRHKKYPVTAEHELDSDSNASPKPEEPKRKALDEEGKSSRKNSLLINNTTTKSDEDKDRFCWRCHRDSVNISCETCPRSFHIKCLKQQAILDAEHWPCPECVATLKAENVQTRSEAMKGMNLEQLGSLLKHAVKRMIQCTGAEPFVNPVNEKDFPDYSKYIVQPMDLSKLQHNLKTNL